MNQFGNMLRRERKEQNLTLGDLAKKVGISVPYLSQIETGTKPLQDKLVERFVTELGLIGDDANALRRAAAVSMGEYSIRMEEGASNDDRILASMLAAGFARLPRDKKDQLREIMKDSSRG
ncbi:helix-turn-helix domain-containing protein [Sphingomonas sp.]|uniref:helix-turn-helix domain-containing protein n=1 Tax=Sphingomonas sp. TaxID=28214 RepID=UPI0035B34B28